MVMRFELYHAKIQQDDLPIFCVESKIRPDDDAQVSLNLPEFFNK